MLTGIKYILRLWLNLRLPSWFTARIQKTPTEFIDAMENTSKISKMFNILFYFFIFI